MRRPARSWCDAFLQSLPMRTAARGFPPTMVSPQVSSSRAWGVSLVEGDEGHLAQATDGCFMPDSTGEAFRARVLPVGGQEDP